MAVYGQLDQEASSQAAELALGLLEGGELRSAERRMRQDARFRDEVAMWQAHFASLFDASRARAPPGARGRIDTGLFGTSPGNRLRRAADWLTAILTPTETVVLFALKVGLLASLAVWLL